MKLSKKVLILGLIIMLIFSAFALFPSVFAPYGAKEMFKAWQEPCASHFLGTNDMGYDIFSEIIYATGSTLLIGIVSAFISLVIGSALGITAGYLPGWKGEISGGIIQIFLLIPMLPMAIVIAAFFGTDTKIIIIIISVLGWSATARTVRTRTMQLKQTAFVESLMILGISKTQIMFKHILPNLSEVILSRYIMSVARCMMLEATLSFMGLGDPTEVTWGRMINIAYKRGGFTRGAYNWLASPGVCIALIVIAFYCINQYFAAKSEEVSGGQSYLD
ncbi:MAG: ABC transporter permease [Candidatus Metalachnospira sp.]|nr:ABC transporter permease [Candidatus Metalachnospira sp.]